MTPTSRSLRQTHSIHELLSHPVLSVSPKPLSLFELLPSIDIGAMSRPPPTPIRRLLVANRSLPSPLPRPQLTHPRGEIATRIISSARELDIETYAIYISGDSSHAFKASHAIELPSAATFINIDALVGIAKKHKIDAVHPGYGFLSESDVFAQRMWEEAGAAVVGPGWSILASTGDKLKARELAETCAYLS
jgi:hypothetical protein